MKKILSAFLLAGILLHSYTATAQNPDIEKRVKKAEEAYDNEKREEAEKILIETVKKYPDASEAWDKLVSVQSGIYQRLQKEDNKHSFTITATDKNGNKIENDTNVLKLAELMGKMKLSDGYKPHIINTCRMACNYSPKAYSACMMLRRYLADKETDKNVKEEAQKEYARGEKEFAKNNYNTAALFYKKAIELDSTYYKAKLYLGDVYYFTRSYNLAIEEFNNAIAAEPDLLEPRKYLFDALEKTGEEKRAYQVGLDALCVYPDLSMFVKLENTSYELGAKVTFIRDSRGVMPNILKPYTTHKDDFTISPAKNTPWKYYTEALANVKSFCDDDGLIKDNSITKEKYLEVYSWQYMLGKASATEFETARQMQEKGFLDCYVFINCFHNDFYQQYKHFVANNREHINKYFDYLKTLK
jgi:tetratricopeptide (TPR) repeat protein